MRRSRDIGMIAGTSVRAQITFLLFQAWIAAAGCAQIAALLAPRAGRGFHGKQRDPISGR